VTIKTLTRPHCWELPDDPAYFGTITWGDSLFGLTPAADNTRSRLVKTRADWSMTEADRHALYDPYAEVLSLVNEAARRVSEAFGLYPDGGATIEDLTVPRMSQVLSECWAWVLDSDRKTGQLRSEKLFTWLASRKRKQAVHAISEGVGRNGWARREKAERKYVDYRDLDRRTIKKAKEKLDNDPAVIARNKRAAELVLDDPTQLPVEYQGTRRALSNDSSRWIVSKQWDGGA
jgi:hypothetical protein